MKALRSTQLRRLACAFLIAVIATGITFHIREISSDHVRPLTDGETMIRFVTLGALAVIASFSLLTACASAPVPAPEKTSPAAPLPASVPARPFMAQVVGVQWLNPLQRRDYTTEWQLLWTLGKR